jgi:oligosaccharide repeat unit polymerase
MDIVRLSLIFSLLALAAIGTVHYRGAIFNPTSVLSLPLAGALVAEEVVNPQGMPFGFRAEVYIFAAVAVYTVGTVLRPVPDQSVRHRLVVSGRTAMQQNWVDFLMVAGAIALIPAAQYVSHLYAATAASISSSVFDRGLVTAALSGSGQSIIERIITAYGVLFAVPVGLYWLTKRKWRIPIMAFYAFGLIKLGDALRARLPIILAILLTFLVIHIGRFSGHKRKRRFSTIVQFFVVLIVVYGVFNQIYSARHVGQTASTQSFVYSIAGGPSAFSESLEGMPVTIEGGHGVSVEGLLSFFGRSRTLGNFSAVTLGKASSSPQQINVYTGIGVLDLDIGFPLMLVVMFLAGIAMRLLWSKAIRSPTVGSITACAAMSLLIVSMPVGLLSQYNFWWALFLAPPVVNRLFKLELAEERLTEVLSSPVHKPERQTGPVDHRQYVTSTARGRLGVGASRLLDVGRERDGEPPRAVLLDNDL